MAIYKPSNCAPFLGAVDLTLPDVNGEKQDELKISFEINSSNVTRVTAYKIKILDNNNEVIFEGDKFSLVPGGGWLSGTEQQVPLIKKVESKPTNPDHNIIYFYGNKFYKYYYGEGNTEQEQEVENFKNGGTNQPYKWIITLAQGYTSEGAPKVGDDKWWDIPVAQGKILGSTPKRIQGEYSEKIFTDYFVQLYGENSVELPRARISSYDYSFGYIYPQEGQFTQKNVDDAKTFKIFRNATDPQYIDTNRKVNFVYKYDINTIKINGVSRSDKFQNDTSSNSGGLENSAGIYVITYSGDVTSQVLAAYRNIWGDNFAAESTSILFTNNSDKNATDNVDDKGDPTEGFSSVPCNGVFMYVSAILKDGKTVVKWQRPAAFKNISAYIDRDIYALNTGLNYSNNAASGDVLGSTNLQFSDEKPIEIYPDKETEDKKYTGEVYKNSTDETYIRPANNISSEMRFSYYDNKGELHNNIIESYDAKKYFVKLSGLKDPLTPYSDTDGVKNTYTISSFFKTSDENPFYAYTNPTIIIRNAADNSVISEDYQGSIGSAITQRYITFKADFVQDNNKSWRNFQYELMDITTGNGQIGEKKYSGEIKDTFYGLQNGHAYGVTLTIEDEFGNILVREGYFNVEADFITSSFPFEATFDCLTHSVILNFINDGIVIPRPNLVDQLLKTKNSTRAFVVIQKGSDGQPAVVWSKTSGALSSVPTLADCIENKYVYRYTPDGATSTVYGQFNDDTEQVILNSIIASTDGIIYKGALYYVRNKFYGEGNFPWVISYPQVGGNQHKMVLGNLSEGDETDISSYKALMEYSSLNNGASLPASENGNITFRSVHQIGTEYFCGSIVEYYIDTENYNNVPSRFKISIIVPSVTYNGSDVYATLYNDVVENKDLYANPERNGIYLEIVRQLKNNLEADKWEDVNASLIRKWFDFYTYKSVGSGKSQWIKTEYDGESGKYWQAKNPVVSSWINKDWISGIDKTKYDYIDTEYFYSKDKDGSIVTGYKNLRGEGVLNRGDKSLTSGELLTIPSPFKGGNKSDKNETVWYDKAVQESVQANSTIINAISLEDAIWQDDSEGITYYWQDKQMSTPFYEQTNINDTGHNYTGRQNIVNKKFLFNVVLKNYDDKNKQLTTINEENITAQCYIVEG